MADEIIFSLCGFVIWEEFEYLPDLVYEVILLLVLEPARVEYSLEVFNLLGHFCLSSALFYLIIYIALPYHGKLNIIILFKTLFDVDILFTQMILFG